MSVAGMTQGTEFFNKALFFYFVISCTMTSIYKTAGEIIDEFRKEKGVVCGLGFLGKHFFL